MLFNTYQFIFLFLPVALLIYFSLKQSQNNRSALLWLAFASLFFYGWWNPAYLLLILGSVLFNFSAGLMLAKGEGEIPTGQKKILLACGVAANLILLGYFKYANFFVDNLNSILGTGFHIEGIILPLAISFFTFQQIAYLVDVYRGDAREKDLLAYLVFVTFFPQLIAGPIVRHREMIPQFKKGGMNSFNYEQIAVGLTIFSIGLFKKVILADSVAPLSDWVFGAAAAGKDISTITAWFGALAFTFQIYFDFSGYTDMAIGLARLFGIRLPLNFNSPYKAENIIDFWRRWHMTLSRFLLNYLYIPLGGNRRGVSRRYINIMTTMLLGGLWHGAAWHFVVWGVLHGIYLLINHAWRSFCASLGESARKTLNFGSTISSLITFVAVVFAWVFFRAENVESAMLIIAPMVNVKEIYSNYSFPILYEMLTAHPGTYRVILILLAVWFLPNTQQIMQNYKPAIDTGETHELKPGWLLWRPSSLMAAVAASAIVVSILKMNHVLEFVYFQF